MSVTRSESEALTEGLTALGQSLDDQQAESLLKLLDELERWNRKFNLTAVRDRREMLTLHILDSLAVRPWLHGDSILDIGTGAGFPGLPLALAEPARRFVLLDGNNKKIQFVRHAAMALGLDNVAAVKARAEDYAPAERFDTVTARAVAELATLVDVAGHLVREDGVFVALKGRYPAEELDKLPDDWETSAHAVSVPGLAAGSRHVVLLRRPTGINEESL